MEMPQLERHSDVNWDLIFLVIESVGLPCVAETVEFVTSLTMKATLTPWASEFGGAGVSATRQRDRQKMRLMLLRTAILLLAGRARAHCVPPPDVASFLGATCTPDECVSDAFTNCTYICGEACCSKRISNESCASLRSFVTALPCSEHENCPDGQSCCNRDNTVGDVASEGTCGDVCTSSVIIAPGANAYASPFPTRSYI